MSADILIIDDEQALRESTGAILEQAGYQVKYAEDSAKALHLVHEHHFDIFLVDYVLPDMNGIEFIQQALAIYKDSVPIIITGSSSIEIAVQGMRIGAHDYLLKPVNIDDLLRIISGILTEREEFNRGKANLNQTIQKISEGAESVITTIVRTKDNIQIKKKKKSLLHPATQLYKDVTSLFKKTYN